MVNVFTKMQPIGEMQCALEVVFGVRAVVTCLCGLVVAGSGEDRVQVLRI